MFEWAEKASTGYSLAMAINEHPSHDGLILRTAANAEMSKIHIQAHAKSNINNSDAPAAGIELPSHPKGCADSLRPRFWLGPNEWLVVGGDNEVGDLRDGLAGLAVGGTVAITDLTDFYEVLELSGDNGIKRLAEGCGVDLGFDAFTCGAYALTRLFDVSVILHKLSTRNDFAIYTDRSLARHLANWLVGSVADL